jgi:hypothetical protein
MKTKSKEKLLFEAVLENVTFDHRYFGRFSSVQDSLLNSIKGRIITNKGRVLDDPKEDGDGQV